MENYGNKPDFKNFMDYQVKKLELDQGIKPNNDNPGIFQNMEQNAIANGNVTQNVPQNVILNDTQMNNVIHLKTMDDYSKHELPIIKFLVEGNGRINKNGEIEITQDGQKYKLSGEAVKHWKGNDVWNTATKNTKEKYQLAPGFKTESERSLYEADPNEFVLLPNGNKNWSEITSKVSQIAKKIYGVDMPSAYIRIVVGNKNMGLIHCKECHVQDFINLGYPNTKAAILDVLNNFNKIYVDYNRGKSPTYNLIMDVDRGQNKKTINTPLAFRLTEDIDGNYYVVIFIMPKKDKDLFRQIKKEVLAYDLQHLDEVSPSDAGNSFRGEELKSDLPSPRLATSVMQNTSFSNESIDSVKGTTVPEVPSKGNMVHNTTSTENIALEKDLVKEKENTNNSIVKSPKLPLTKLGKEDELIIDNNKKIVFRYALMPAKEIVASNRIEDYSVNPVYPKEYQPRDRARVAMRQQVQTMASN